METASIVIKLGAVGDAVWSRSLGVPGRWSRFGFGGALVAASGSGRRVGGAYLSSPVAVRMKPEIMNQPPPTQKTIRSHRG